MQRGALGGMQRGRGMPRGVPTGDQTIKISIFHFYLDINLVFKFCSTIVIL